MQEIKIDIEVLEVVMNLRGKALEAAGEAFQEAQLAFKEATEKYLAAKKDQAKS